MRRIAIFLLLWPIFAEFPGVRAQTSTPDPMWFMASSFSATGSRYLEFESPLTFSPEEKLVPVGDVRKDWRTFVHKENYLFANCSGAPMTAKGTVGNDVRGHQSYTVTWAAPTGKNISFGVPNNKLGFNLVSRILTERITGEIDGPDESPDRATAEVNQVVDPGTVLTITTERDVSYLSQQFYGNIAVDAQVRVFTAPYKPGSQPNPPVQQLSVVMPQNDLLIQPFVNLTVPSFTSLSVTMSKWPVPSQGVPCFYQGRLVKSNSSDYQTPPRPVGS